MDIEEMTRWAAVNEATRKMALAITKHVKVLSRTPITELLIRDITDTHEMLGAWEKSPAVSGLSPDEALFVGKVIGRLEALYAILSKMV